MTTTFQDFTAGRTNLKFAPGLILGWLTTDNAAQTETRYALYADGRALQADPVGIFAPGCNDFAPKGRAWTPVKNVPEHAEFIGNYKPPVR